MYSFPPSLPPPLPPSGSMRDLDVIDVSRQDDLRMKMREWTDYYEDVKGRKKILNVISLEFTGTEYVGQSTQVTCNSSYVGHRAHVVVTIFFVTIKLLYLVDFLKILP